MGAPHGEEGPSSQCRICCAPHMSMGYEWGGAHCRGGMVLVCHFSCSEGVSCSTSSHRWGRFHLPRFLLRDGSFTWMYMASLTVLVTPSASLSIMVKHSRST